VPIGNTSYRTVSFRVSATSVNAAAATAAGSAADATVSIDEAGTTIPQIGATWTQTRPAADSAMAAHAVQAQHIQSFGAPDNFSPSAGSYNLAALEPYVQDIIDAGATKPIIILCRAPGWSKPATISTIDADDWSPAPGQRTNWANLCAAVVDYFDGSTGPLVEYYSFWNEMKGYWLPHKVTEAAAYTAYANGYGGVADNGNRWHYERYTADYNAAYTACHTVRDSIHMGGPYVILRSGSSGALGGDASALTWTGGVMDQRALDVVDYFVANATGYEFLSCDGGFENQAGTEIPEDPYVQIEKLWAIWSYIRDNHDATCELINFETYINQVKNSPWSYTESEIEDLFIELVTQTQANISTPNVSYLVWNHPSFWPQVVTRSSESAWSNSASPFKAKVDTWHAG
jgi:hypothetical protein